MTWGDRVWVPRHLIRAPEGVPDPPPAHLAGRASPLPTPAPPQGAAPSGAAAVCAPAPPGRACAGRRGECERPVGNPAPPPDPPRLDTPLERDTLSGWLLSGFRRPPASWTPTPTPARLRALSGPGHLGRSGARRRWAEPPPATEGRHSCWRP